MAANVDLYSLSSEGSLVCHTYSPRTRDTHTYCRAFDSGAVTTCFNYLGLSRLGFENVHVFYNKKPTYFLKCTNFIVNAFHLKNCSVFDLVWLVHWVLCDVTRQSISNC